MSVHWYYEQERQPQGPVSDEEFRQLVDEGTVTPATLVWNESLDDWQRLEAIAEEAGIVFPAQQAPTTAPYPPLPEYTPAPELAEKIRVFSAYGGFWIRAGAKLLDSIAYIIIGMPFLMMLVARQGGLESLEAIAEQEQMPVDFQIQVIVVFACIQIMYDGFFVGLFEATPGKMICRLKIVRPDGTRLGVGLAFLRTICEAALQVFWLTSLLNYLAVIPDEEKRALHDRVCKTRVVVRS